MAYISKNLSVMKDANGVTEWSYITTDTAATVNTSGYFTGDAVNMLRVGDVIRIRQFDDVTTRGTITAITDAVVVSNDGTTVDISDGVALALTDSD